MKGELKQVFDTSRLVDSLGYAIENRRIFNRFFSIVWLNAIGVGTDTTIKHMPWRYTDFLYHFNETVLSI